MATTQGISGPGRSAAVLGGMAVGGLMSVIGPVLVAGTPLMPAPLFPLLRTGVEKLGWPALVLLLGLGVLGGLLSSVRASWLGLASVALLPLAAVLEIAKDGTSHNLIPLELGMYLFVSLAAGIGARGARWARCRRRSR